MFKSFCKIRSLHTSRWRQCSLSVFGKYWSGNILYVQVLVFLQNSTLSLPSGLRQPDQQQLFTQQNYTLTTQESSLWREFSRWDDDPVLCVQMNVLLLVDMYFHWRRKHAFSGLFQILHLIRFKPSRERLIIIGCLNVTTLNTDPTINDLYRFNVFGITEARWTGQ